MGYTAHVLLYHLAAICTPAQRKAPFLECDFVVGSITGETCPDTLVEARTGLRYTLRPGALLDMRRAGLTLPVVDAGIRVEPSFTVWAIGQRTAALQFLRTLTHGASGVRSVIVEGVELLFVPPEALLCRLAAARLARSLAEEAVAIQSPAAAAAAEVAYALAVHPPTQTAWPGATRDRELYNLVGRAYAVSGRHGPVNPELFEPQADRSSRDVIPNFGDYLA